MTERSVLHASVTVERVFEASAARVFAAWSDEEALLRWGNPGEGWDVAYERFDFRVGGTDINVFGPTGEPGFRSTMTYVDIVPDRRIVMAGGMHHQGEAIAGSLLTVDMVEEDGKCRLTLTEQSAFLDGKDKPEWREAGWGQMLDNLGTEVETRRAA